MAGRFLNCVSDSDFVRHPLEGREEMPQVAMSPADKLRRKSRNRKIIIGFFIFIGLVVALESPLTRVRHIQVSGNTTIPEQQIIADSGLHAGVSLWQVNGSHLANLIRSQEPMVQSVDVTTDWLQGTIHVALTERHVVAIYEGSGKFYELLNNGIVYKTIEPKNGLSFPVITSSVAKLTVGQAVSPEVATICGQLSKLGADKVAGVSEFHANSNGTVSLYLDNGFVVTADVSGLAGAVNVMGSTVDYFISHGYKPGTIDLSGLPPYRYTPFAGKSQSSKAKGSP